MFWYIKLLVLIKIVNLLKINVLKILIWVWIMSWLEYYGLIDIGMIYLVDLERFWVKMILSYVLFKRWIWARCRSVGDLWKNPSLGLKITRFQSGPSIYKDYSLVLELWKNYGFVPGAKFEILDRI
jgi:uncharacterized membrane protein (Fun14 family)